MKKQTLLEITTDDLRELFEDREFTEKELLIIRTTLNQCLLDFSVVDPILKKSVDLVDELKLAGVLK